eukprot:CAMPEP_0173425008 /NCGR_PEP_ID=MMETSP1357-20121228/4814_1 /TAXON_ID=77926 /ORGANISM="Hemiselmis rufescens, Strain PCC563" /LENGTH=69 /DNA_ID=CAMNT_0014388357 /DNA_START=9 /DNA_END=218 /DNA_ORIENTATION=-
MTLPPPRPLRCGAAHLRGAADTQKLCGAQDPGWAQALRGGTERVGPLSGTACGSGVRGWDMRQGDAGHC